MIEDVKAMQVFVDTMVGIPKFSYPGHKNAPRPKSEFAWITMIEEYQESIPTQTILNQSSLSTTFRIISLARLRFRIGVVETSGIAASKIMHGWTSEAVKSLMMSSGYGFVRIIPISLEDDKLEKKWEPRQGFSVELYVTRIFEEVVNNITQVQISGEYITDTLDTVLTNISINE